MPNPLLSVRISPDLEQLLQQKESELGKTRSEITIEALQAYLKPPSAEDQLGRLEQQVKALQSAFRKHFPMES